MPLRRHADWPARLAAAIEARAATPFAWGAHDCCLAPCDLVAAITGSDVGQAFRGYDSRLGATRALMDVAGSNVPVAGLLEAAARITAARFGMAEVATRRAQRGDVVLTLARVAGELDPVPVLSVVDVSGMQLVTAAPVGWQRLAFAGAIAAWRV